MNEKIKIKDYGFNNFMELFKKGCSIYVYRKNVYIGIVNADTIIKSGHIYNIDEHDESITLSMAYTLIIFDEFEIIE